MRTLEDRLNQASDEARQQVEQVVVRPASTVGERLARRRALVATAAVVLVIGVFGATATLTGGSAEHRIPAGSAGTSVLPTAVTSITLPSTPTEVVSTTVPLVENTESDGSDALEVSPTDSVATTTTIVGPSGEAQPDQLLPDEAPGDLIAATTTVDVLPHVLECPVPQDSEPSPNRGDILTGGTVYETPEDAFYGFLKEIHLADSGPGLAVSGYTKMELPDGFIAFGKPFDGDDSYLVTLVSVSQTDEGWVATKWEASGC